MKYLTTLVMYLFFLSLIPTPAWFSNLVSGQSICPNSNFAAKNFSNWQGYYGTFYNPAENQGFITYGNARHLIISAPGDQDYNTCNGLLTLPPGETNCARLGNDYVGSEAEQLRYSFPVTDANNLFIYKYAVVLEDPGHEPDHQPSFTIEVMNENGVLFDPQCGYYYVFAQASLPGWNTCNTFGTPVIWKDWTTVGLDLSQLVGQTVTVIFTTRDCEESGHFGYAYLSTYCSRLQLSVGFCLENSTVTVSAPPGFSYQWSTGDTTQHITVINPPFGTLINCTLTAVNGCQAVIQATVQPTILDAGFSYISECAGTPLQFHDETLINQNQVVDRIWDFGDGSPIVTGDSVPSHTYNAPGDYEVSLIAVSTEGCTDTIISTVTVLPRVAVDLGDDVYIKWQGQVTLDAGNPGSRYLWSTGDTTRVITTGGEQMVWVYCENDQCSASDTLFIHEYPRCIAEVPNAFSPNGDGENDRLELFTSGTSTLDFMVFDRSGQVVFSTRDPSGSWDGTYKGRGLGMGVFNYTLQGRCSDGDGFFRKGNITLLK